jgi:hypothetical protein
MVQSQIVLERIESGEEPILAVSYPAFRSLNRATVFRWLMSGRLPAVRMGRKFFTTASVARETLLSGALDQKAGRPKKAPAIPATSHKQAVARLEALAAQDGRGRKTDAKNR